MFARPVPEPLSPSGGQGGGDCPGSRRCLLALGEPAPPHHLLARKPLLLWPATSTSPSSEKPSLLVLRGNAPPAVPRFPGAFRPCCFSWLCACIPVRPSCLTPWAPGRPRGHNPARAWHTAGARHYPGEVLSRGCVALRQSEGYECVQGLGSSLSHSFPAAVPVASMKVKPNSTQSLAPRPVVRTH